jgi:tetratricopeptide (TPR) repeat protein
MNKFNKETVVISLLTAALLAGSVVCQRQITTERGREATLEEVLYLPSGKILKKMSLGYSSLLADIYWTRAVQYFGSQHIGNAPLATKSTNYSLLYPLLNITSDLDPHILVVYQFGSIFLSQQPPEGAGQPDKAVALVEKGIRENPEYWRLYFTLGFIHYVDRKDYKAAQEAFEKGSRIPGALPWMKVMAARMAERGKDVNTAIALWRAVYDSAQDMQVKKTAISHLGSIRADLDIMELDKRVNAYHGRTGAYPQSWEDLIRAGLLRGIPEDPHGEPYKLLLNGLISVQNPKQFPFLNEWRYQ